MAREFQRGHKAKISDLTAGTDLYVGVQISGPGLSFDISCFGLDGAEQLSDERYFIFFNQPKSPEESIQQLGAQAGDTESFRVTLDRIPANVQKLSFTATVDGPGQMSQAAPGYIRIVAGGEEVARYAFHGGEFSTERAVMLGDFYLKDVWRFAAVGQGFDGGLDALLRHFGGEVAEEEPAAPAAPGFGVPAGQPAPAPGFAPPPGAAAAPAAPQAAQPAQPAPSFGAPQAPAPAAPVPQPQTAQPPQAPQAPQVPQAPQAPQAPPPHAAPTIAAPLAAPPGPPQPGPPQPPPGYPAPGQVPGQVPGQAPYGQPPAAPVPQQPQFGQPPGQAMPNPFGQQAAPHLPQIPQGPAAGMAVTFDAYREVPTGGRWTAQNGQLVRVDLGIDGQPVLARQGSMVLYQGKVDFSHKGAGFAGRIAGNATGQEMQLMRCSGKGQVFFAEEAAQLHPVELQGDALCVSAENVLAFDESLQYEVRRIEGHGIPGGALFTMQFQGTGTIVVKTHGIPVVLPVTPTTFADAQAVVAWSAAAQVIISSQVRLRRQSYPGHTGEGVNLQFRGAPGSFIVVQPYEV